MSLLANLKKQRKSQLEAATKAMESGGGQKSDRKVDERFWKLTPDDQGNAAAIIRFLPPVVDGDEMPWVKVDRFAFKGKTGKWYINNSLRTLGKEDPVSKMNYHDWNEVGTEAAKNDVRRRKAQPKYIFNIYVIKDVNHPENEGKVFLYEAGKQVFGWIQEKAQPEDDPLSGPVEPTYVWDLWEGANFRFKAYTEAPYLKYDKSTFDTPSEFLGGDEEKIEAVLKQCHSLNQFIAPENFKTYEELEKELLRVEGVGSAPQQEKAPSLEDIPVSSPKKDKPAPTKEEGPAPTGGESDDDQDLAYFKSLIGD